MAVVLAQPVTPDAERPAKLRVFLAENHTTVREGLRLIVDAQPDMEVVGEATDGTTVLAQARELEPDVVVMDLSMPQLSGLQATEQLRREAGDIKVLVLTRHREAGYLRQALRAGASGYVLKQSRSSELLKAIRAVAEGDTYLDSAIARDIVHDYAHTPGPHPARGLSTREEEVLRRVASGYSNKEIAAQLDLSVKTVETHKANAMLKLNLHSRAAIVRFALQSGWLEEA
jgi:DNA-binding NarL/FixJ family response regulator